MSTVKENVVPSGQHYSGANRVPNIKQFVESLDKDKKLRDTELEQRVKSEASGQQSGETTDHTDAKPNRKNNRRVVTDPVTGKGR